MTDLLMPARVVFATLLVMWLPGALLACAIGIRARHFLESLALGVFGSSVIVAALGLVTLSIGATIGWVVAAIVVINAGLTLWLWRRRHLQHLRPRWLAVDDLALAGGLGFFAIVAFRWGDDIRAVGWEVALHVAYVRQYASGLPLEFHTAVLRPPEIAAQNYFYLWEFLLAAIARASGVDPMVAALKARWCIPPFAFAAFFFMVQRLTASTRAALSATWVMVAAVAVQFLTLPPNAYDKFIQSGPLRQVGAFFGSIHHSDAAMEILLPLAIGVLFWAVRRPRLATWIWFAVALAIAFLWHPREYFQVMWYGGVAIVVDVIGGLRRAVDWQRRSIAYATMIGVYVAVAVVLYLGIPSSIRQSAEHTTGLATQWTAIRQFVSSAGDWSGWLAGSRPFGFHLHGFEVPGLAAGPPMTFSWLVLAVPAALLLALSPRRSLRWFALYLLVLWVMSLCSYRFEQLLQAITYEEILISKPRLVHLFAYAIVGLGWFELVRRAAGRSSGVAASARALVVALILGFAFAWAWRSNADDVKPLFARLDVLFFATLAALVIAMRWRRRPAMRSSLGWSPRPVVAGLAFAVFALPVCAAPAAGRWKAMLAHRLDATTLFAVENPVELAPDTIQYLQMQHPPRQRMLIEPGKPYMVGVYAPIYVLPLLGNIGADSPQFQAMQQGTHPIFNPATLKGTLDTEPVRNYLAGQRVAHILATGAFATAMAEWPVKAPQDFETVFRSQDGTNIVLAVRRQAS